MPTRKEVDIGFKTRNQDRDKLRVGSARFMTHFTAPIKETATRPNRQAGGTCGNVNAILRPASQSGSSASTPPCMSITR